MAVVPTVPLLVGRLDGNLLLPNRSDRPSAMGPTTPCPLALVKPVHPVRGEGDLWAVRPPDNSYGCGSSRVKPLDDIPAKRQGPNQAAKAGDD